MNFRNPFEKCVIVGEGVTSKEYMKQKVERGHPDYVMSRSSLMEFAQCPHKWIQTPDSDSSKALDWGSLVDCILFTPDAFKGQFILKPEKYINSKKQEVEWSNQSKTCQKWVKEQRAKGFSVVDSYDVAEAQRAVAALEKDSKASALINDSKFQVMVTGYFKDWDTGLRIPCKILIDMVPDSRNQFGNALADFKTSNDATAQKWARHVNDYDYDAQAGMQLDMFNAESGQERFEFLHVVQESSSPFEIGRRSLSQEFLEIGRHKYASALRLYAWCLKNNKWPGYDDTTNEFENGWRLTQPEPWMIKDCPFIIPERASQLTNLDEPVGAS